MDHRTFFKKTVFLMLILSNWAVSYYEIKGPRFYTIGLPSEIEKVKRTFYSQVFCPRVPNAYVSCGLADDVFDGGCTLSGGELVFNTVLFFTLCAAQRLLVK